MVPALTLIIAVLTALLVRVATAPAHAARDRIDAGHQSISTNRVFLSASMPAVAATASIEALRNNRKPPSIVQVARVVSASFKFCKIPKAYREAFTRPQRIPKVEEILRPYG